MNNNRFRIRQSDGHRSPPMDYVPLMGIIEAWGLMNSARRWINEAKPNSEYNAGDFTIECVPGPAKPATLPVDLSEACNFSRLLTDVLSKQLERADAVQSYALMRLIAEASCLAVDIGQFRDAVVAQQS